MNGQNRVLRGDSWNNDAANCRTANRNNNDPANRNTNNGFRLALNSAGRRQHALSFQTEQIVFLLTVLCHRWRNKRRKPRGAGS